MSGANNGTGRPLCFRCSHCRVFHRTISNNNRECGYANGVDLTGKRRAIHGNCGNRNSDVQRQYQCHCCKHIGWSRHTDLERKEKHEDGS